MVCPFAIHAAGIFLIYISTDYVFDGRNPPYGENDTPNPLNMYGKSKLKGEEEILRHCPGMGNTFPLNLAFLNFSCISFSTVLNTLNKSYHTASKYSQNYLCSLTDKEAK